MESLSFVDIPKTFFHPLCATVAAVDMQLHC